MTLRIHTTRNQSARAPLAPMAPRRPAPSAGSAMSAARLGHDFRRVSVREPARGDSIAVQRQSEDRLPFPWSLPSCGQSATADSLTGGAGPGPLEYPAAFEGGAQSAPVSAPLAPEAQGSYTPVSHGEEAAARALDLLANRFPPVM